MNTGDDKSTVLANRERFFSENGFASNKIAFADQRHSAAVAQATEAGIYPECDALITNKANLPLVIQVADCACVYLYDKENHAIGLIHSGWRGTAKNILGETISAMNKAFGSEGKNISAAISPCISQENFEVGEDVFVQFDQKYFRRKSENKWLLDLKSVLVDQLHSAAVQEIELDDACTFADSERYFSYRRDREKSGRMMGFFVLESL